LVLGEKNNPTGVPLSNSSHGIIVAIPLLPTTRIAEKEHDAKVGKDKEP
jgi:hypothetical protein